MRRLEERRKARLFAEMGSTMKLPRSGKGRLSLEVIELADQERPPMIRIPEYIERRRALLGDAAMATCPSERRQRVRRPGIRAAASDALTDRPRAASCLSCPSIVVELEVDGYRRQSRDWPSSSSTWSRTAPRSTSWQASRLPRRPAWWAARTDSIARARHGVRRRGRRADRRLDAADPGAPGQRSAPCRDRQGARPPRCAAARDRACADARGRGAGQGRRPMAAVLDTVDRHRRRTVLSRRSAGTSAGSIPNFAMDPDGGRLSATYFWKDLR